MADEQDITLLGSGSKLYRSLECPASVHLPQSPKGRWVEQAAERGTACHTYYQYAPDEGLKALESVPEKYRELASKMPIHKMASRFTPLYNRETAYAHNGDTGEVREIPAGDQHRDYGTLALHDTPMTIDVVIRGYSMAEVWDLKTGKTPVPPPAVNPQLLHGALCVGAMVSPRADKFVLGIQTMDADGDLHDTADVVDRWALEEHESKIRRAQRVALQVMQAIEAGETPPVNPGPWCKYCDAMAACPVKGKS